MALNQDGARALMAADGYTARRACTNQIQILGLQNSPPKCSTKARAMNKSEKHQR